MTDHDAKILTKAGRRAFLLGAAALWLSACAGREILQHGYLPRKQDMQKLRTGMTKEEVEAVLGSPSTTASIEQLDDSYYYISTTMTRPAAFLKPKVADRKVLAIRFDKSGRVAHFATYGLKDGQVVRISGRKTPVSLKEKNFLRSLFGGIGGPKLPGT